MLNKIPTLNNRFFCIKDLYPLTNFKYLTLDEYNNIIHLVIHNTCIKSYDNYKYHQKYLLFKNCHKKLNEYNNNNKFKYLHAMSILSLFSRKWRHYYYKFGGKGYSKLALKYL